MIYISVILYSVKSKMSRVNCQIARFFDSASLCHDIDDLSGNVNFLEDRLPVQRGGDLRVGLRGGDRLVLRRVVRDHYGAAQLSADLNGDLDRIVLRLRLVEFGPPLTAKQRIV